MIASLARPCCWILLAFPRRTLERDKVLVAGNGGATSIPVQLETSRALFLKLQQPCMPKMTRA